MFIHIRICNKVLFRSLIIELEDKNDLLAFLDIHSCENLVTGYWKFPKDSAIQDYHVQLK